MNPFSIRSRLAVSLAALAFTPLAALAAGSASVNYGGENGQVYWQDNGTVRVDMASAAGEGYALLRDNKVYMVNPNAPQGMPQVMEVSEMFQLAAGFINEDEDDMFKDLGENIQSIRKTGAHETIAGIQGEVYEITMQDETGNIETEQLVLTDDPTVIELSEAFLGFTGSMVGTNYMNPLKAALPKGKHGLLRIGDGMIVESLDRNTPAASIFELPSEPVNFGGMMKRLMEQATQQ